jgi:cytoskeletal protein CcmA (bactofilin family)
MFTRDKRREQTADQTNGFSNSSQALDAGATPDGPSQDFPLRPLTSAQPAPAAIAPHPLLQALMRAPMQAPEQSRKKLVIAEGITIKGEILGCEHLAIEGEAYALIDRCGKLEVLADGILKGSATVADAEISGRCEGTLSVKDTLHVRRTARIVGSVQYGRLLVEEGGRIEGELKSPLTDNKYTGAEPKTQADHRDEKFSSIA